MLPGPIIWQLKMIFMQIGIRGFGSRGGNGVTGGSGFYCGAGCNGGYGDINQFVNIYQYIASLSSSTSASFRITNAADCNIDRFCDSR